MPHSGYGSVTRNRGGAGAGGGNEATAGLTSGSDDDSSGGLVVNDGSGSPDNTTSDTSSTGPSRLTRDTRTDGDAGATVTVTTTSNDGQPDNTTSGESGSSGDSGGGMDPSDSFVAGLYGATGDSDTTNERDEFLNQDSVTPGDLSGEAVSQLFDLANSPSEQVADTAQNTAETIRERVVVPFVPGMSESDGGVDGNILLVGLLGVAAVVAAAVFGSSGSGSGSGMSDNGGGGYL